MIGLLMNESKNEPKKLSRRDPGRKEERLGWAKERFGSSFLGMLKKYRLTGRKISLQADLTDQQLHSMRKGEDVRVTTLVLALWAEVIPVEAKIWFFANLLNLDAVFEPGRVIFETATAERTGRHSHTPSSKEKESLERTPELNQRSGAVKQNKAEQFADWMRLLLRKRQAELAEQNPEFAQNLYGTGVLRGLSPAFVAYCGQRFLMQEDLEQIFSGQPIQLDLLLGLSHSLGYGGRMDQLLEMRRGGELERFLSLSPSPPEATPARP